MDARARHRGLARLATLLLLAGLLAVAAFPAAAADREIVLTHGHIDGFEVTYDDDTGELVLLVKDDTRIHDPGIVFRDPEDVTIAFEDEQALLTLPSGGAWGFFGPYQGAQVWVGQQSGDDQGYVPWVGWSTERLHASLDGTGIVPAAGQPVQLDIAVDGPGEVFTWMTDAFSNPINRYINTIDENDDVIPISANAHVHTNWAFTAEGDYCLTVTPNLATVDHGTIDGPPAVYHLRVGATVSGGDHAPCAGNGNGNGGNGNGGNGNGNGDGNGGPGDVSQDIVVTLDETAGALVISVDPEDRTVNLPPFELASNGASWETSGELRPVTVTDTRVGAPGWTASGQVTDFESVGGESFAGSHLGWQPQVLDQTSGQGVSPGAQVAPGFPSGDGLSVARTLASTEAGDGIGTAELGADLELRIPTDAQPGTYEATLTFTVM